MKKTDQYIMEYEHATGAKFRPADAVRSMSYIMGFLSMFVGAAAFNCQSSLFDGLLADVRLPFFDFYLVPSPVTETLFLLGGIWVVLAAWSGRTLIAAHVTIFLGWAGMSVSWIIYGIVSTPDYMFTFGVMGLLISALHLIVAKIWSIERVV